jgi:hypothetical protein
MTVDDVIRFDIKMDYLQLMHET